MYLDHAATTSLRPQARDALIDALDRLNANASGTHGPARAAKNALEEARERAASLLGVSPMEVVFTSGGTEADNLAISGVLAASGDGGLVTSVIEHKAVSEPAKAAELRGHTVRFVGCDSRGVVAVEDVVGAVDEQTVLVSVMAANNEVGTLQPIAQIADAVHAAHPGTVVHTDAVQAFVGADLATVVGSADMVSLAAHKFGGPKGVGLLTVPRTLSIEALLIGGGQEAGRRSGTSNVPGIVSMVAAMEAAVADRARFDSAVASERDAFEAELLDRLGDVTFTASEASRMPHFSHVRIPGVVAESLLIRLDSAGVHAAAGSACQSGAVEPSHVLTAMGMPPEQAAECVRFTFGWDTGAGEGRAAANAVADVVEAMR